MSFGSPVPGQGPSVAAEEAASPYLRAISRHRLLVAVVAILTVVAAAITVARRTPSYQATASVLVTPLSPTNPDLIGIGAIVDSGDPARNVQTAGALLDSPTAAAQTAAAIRHGYTLPSVQHAVTVAPLGQSNVVSITATAANPATAQNLANVFARQALAYRASVVGANISRQIARLSAALVGSSGGSATDLRTRLNSLRQLQSDQDPSLALASQAQRPTSTSGTSKALVLILALIGGLALGCVAAVLVERFTGRVRDENEVVDLLGVPILSGVPKLTRAQARRATRPDLLPPAVFEQFRLLRAQLDRRQGPIILMVTSADAGDGKTSVASSLAVAAGEIAEQVVLLDLDLAKPEVAALFGIEERVGEDLLTDPTVPLSKMLVEAPDHPDIRVLPSHHTDLVSFEAVIDRLPDLLEEAAATADWIIVDSPPLTAVTSGLRIVQMCQQVLLVVRPNRTDRSRLTLTRDLLRRVGASIAGVVLVGTTIARVKSEYGYGWSESTSRFDTGREQRSRRRRGKRDSVELSTHE